MKEGLCETCDHPANEHYQQCMVEGCRCERFKKIEVIPKWEITGPTGENCGVLKLSENVSVEVTYSYTRQKWQVHLQENDLYDAIAWFGYFDTFEQAQTEGYKKTSERLKELYEKIREAVDAAKIYERNERDG